jgi:uncharacterized membrane protein YedE/YeeE
MQTAELFRMDTNFTPLAATVGGLLVGTGAAIGLLYHGRIAGISSILGSFLARPRPSGDWEAPFLAGLIAGGLLLLAVLPGAIDPTSDRSLFVVALAGLFVGVGTAMGSGCTSGHGVCGLGRLSPRSVAATLTFMATGALVVGVFEHLLRGGSR